MSPLVALVYSFLFGLLHGILPDEHTWPITFSYAIGGASGREGIKASFYFSMAFTFQRMLLSELAYLALAPFFLSPTINGIVYVVVGFAMSAAGGVVLRRNRSPHLHLLGLHDREVHQMESKHQPFVKESGKAPPPPWTLIHGFLAGFGFGGFSLFVNTVAAPAMNAWWAGFLPGLLFGLGTMFTLVIIGAVFGASLRWIHSLTEQEIKKMGAKVGGRTLFYGGFLFTLFGFFALSGLDHHLPVGADYLLIGLFMIIVAVPAFIYSLREVLKAKRGLPSE